METNERPLSRRKSLIFINLPVKDLKRSMDFFASLGFDFNPMFTDVNAACLVLGENLYAMLLVESYFRSFTKLPIADPWTAPESIVALSVESAEDVDQLVDLAFAAGATSGYEPQNLPGMHSRSFRDPDGHFWEFVWMDLVAAGRT